MRGRGPAAIGQVRLCHREDGDPARPAIIRALRRLAAHRRHAEHLVLRGAGQARVRFRLAGYVRCPTFVCHAEGDDISASAPQLADALRGEKTYVRFTAAEGAGDHCEAAARTLYHARSFGWLDAVLTADR